MGKELACTVSIQEGGKEDVGSQSRSVVRFAEENSPVPAFAYLLTCILKLILRFHDVSHGCVFTYPLCFSVCWGTNL